MMKELNEYQKLDWISFAIQEALNGNIGELEQALALVEDLREESQIHTYGDELASHYEEDE